MKRSICLIVCLVYLALFVTQNAVYAIDAETSVKGRWSLSGSQENHIGTPEYHKYDYFYKKRWDYRNGVFYQEGNAYLNTQVSGNTLTADYDDFGDRSSVRIEFSDDKASYAREGHNDAFGDYKVTATATRIKQ